MQQMLYLNHFKGKNTGKMTVLWKEFPNSNSTVYIFQYTLDNYFTSYFRNRIIPFRGGRGNVVKKNPAKRDFI